MIIFGSRGSHLKSITIPHTCGYCGSENTMAVSVYGRYAHVFWIPFFPIGKRGGSYCAHCKQFLEKRELPPELRKKYDEVNKEAKYPFWYYAGLILLGLLFMPAVVTAIIGILARW